MTPIPTTIAPCTEYAGAAPPGANDWHGRAATAASAIVLAFVLTLGLTACGGGSSATNPAPATESTPPQAPSITAAPANQSVTEPAAASWTIVASGTPAPLLQWQLSNDAGATWADIPGATAATYTLQPTTLADDGRRVRVVVSSTAGSVTSAEATLTVLATTAVDVGDVDARFAAITAVEAKLRELVVQQLPAADRINAIAAFMGTRAEYIATGIDAETLSATGVFRDGRLHVVSLNLVPEAGTASASIAMVPSPAVSETATPKARKAAAAKQLPLATGALAATTATASGSEIPTSPFARLSQTFGTNCATQSSVDDANGYLKAKGWKLRTGADVGGSVDALRGVSGDGMFYLNAHGGRLTINDIPFTEPEGKLYALQSSTLWDVALDKDPTLADDLKNWRVVHFTATNCAKVADTRYGITRFFVEKYWNFAPNAVILVNSCWSSRNTLFVEAVQKKGAGAVYLGWDEKLTEPVSNAALRYLTDRMVGANKYLPESPAQRAFPYDQVLTNMAARTPPLDTDPTWGAKLSASAAARPPLATPSAVALAPSIREMVVDEQAGTLTLLGGFGTTKPKVTIGGEPVVVGPSNKDTIVVTLPGAGKGSSGDVQVETDGGVKSNLRQLTEWRMTLNYNWTAAAGLDGLLLAGSGPMRFRADVGGFRAIPGEPLRYTQRLMYATRDSALTLTGSGKVGDLRCTTTLAGSGTFPSALPLGTTTGGLVLANAITVDTKTQLGAFGLGFGAPPTANPFDIVYSGRSCAFSTKLPPLFGELNGIQSFPGSQVDGAPKIPLPALQISFTNDFTLIGRNHIDPSTQNTLRIQWSDAVPTTPPREDVDSGK